MNFDKAKIPVEAKIVLNRFIPRWYQADILRALEHDGFKQVLYVLSRRAGKDILAFNFMIRSAIRRIGTYFYAFPTFAQCKRAIWDASTIDGFKFLEFIPNQLISGINSSEMKITFTNGSIIQFVGSENYDRLRGTNPVGVVLSEYGYQNSIVYKQILRPILLANDGWVIIQGTPFGKNHFYELFQIALHSPKWFCYLKTLDDTKHINPVDLEEDISRGLISRGLVNQEYYCSWEEGATGIYYATYMNKARLEGRIGEVPWEPDFPVHTAWDLGFSDSTFIIFFQIIGQIVRIIDCICDNSQGLEYYVKLLENKPYRYGENWAPHDIRVHDLGTGLSRLERSHNLGLDFNIAPNIAVIDGIEAVRATFHKLWIDEKKCATLIRNLDNYRKEFDEKNKVYRNRPLHDQHSDGCDAMRMLCLSLPKMGDSSSATQLEKTYQETMYGNDKSFDNMFDNSRHR